MSENTPETDDSKIKPSTSKAEEGPSEKAEEPQEKPQVSDTVKQDSDSETQNTSCSEESMEEVSVKTPTVFDNLKLLESAIDELFSVVESKA